MCSGVIRLCANARCSVSEVQSSLMGMAAAVAGVQAMHCTGLFPIKERDGVHLGVVATIDGSQVTLRQVFQECVGLLVDQCHLLKLLPALPRLSASS